MGTLGAACGITFVTQSCVVTTDLQQQQQQHCLEHYRVKHEAIISSSARPDNRLAAQLSPFRTPACMKSCEVYRMQSDSLAGSTLVLSLSAGHKQRVMHPAALA